MSYASDPPGEARSRSSILLEAALSLSEKHDLRSVLEGIIERASDIVGAQYAAVGIYDGEGRIQTFVHRGIPDDVVARIGPPPQGRGLLGEVIVADGPIRLEDLTADPRSFGFPPHHPVMRTFLGVPIASGWRRYGNLYLTEKRGGRPFDAEDERLVVALAAFAAAAIENSLLVASERERAEVQADLAALRERERLQVEMLRKVIEAQEDERARVSRDLHDEIGQSLTSVLLALRLVEDSLAAEPARLAEARGRTAEVRVLVATALREVRALAFQLRPTVLDDLGLVPALRRLTADVAAHRDVAVDLILDGVPDDLRLPPAVETTVYRVVQEALTNVARHAGATRASVTVTLDPAALRAVVADDGAGFESRATTGASLGLRGMAERAMLVGGSLDIESAPGRGTTVSLEVPV